MVTQYYTSTRPDTSAPFWSESEEGKARTLAIFSLMDSHPELVISYDNQPIESTSLSAQFIVKYHDVDAFRAFMDLAKELDPELRNDRANYVRKNGQSLIIEYHIDGMEERGLIAHIQPERVLIQQRDGTVRVIDNNQTP